MMLLYLHPFKYFLTDRFHNNFMIDKIIEKKRLILRKKNSNKYVVY